MKKRHQKATRFSTPSISGSTAQSSKEFVDEKFEITSGFVPLTAEQKEKPAEPGQKKDVTGKPIIEPLTDEEALNFVKGVLTLPHIFLSKIPARTDDQLKPFVHELNLYCNKKGIDLRSYFFDEFGLVVTGCALGYSYVEDYRKFYGKKEQSKEDKKLDADFEHAKEVEEQNKKAKEENKNGISG